MANPRLPGEEAAPYQGYMDMRLYRGPFCDSLPTRPCPHSTTRAPCLGSCLRVHEPVFVMGLLAVLSVPMLMTRGLNSLTLQLQMRHLNVSDFVILL